MFLASEFKGGPADLEEIDANSCHLPEVVRPLDERDEVGNASGNVLNALPELLNEEVHVAEVAQSIIGREVDLALVFQHDIDVACQKT